MHYYRHIVKYQCSKNRNYFLNLLNVEDYKLQLNKLEKYELKRYKELWREVPVIMDWKAAIVTRSGHSQACSVLVSQSSSSQPQIVIPYF